MRKVFRTVRKILHLRHSARVGREWGKRIVTMGIALLILGETPVYTANAADAVQVHDAVEETAVTENAVGGAGGEMIVSDSYASIPHVNSNQGMTVGKYLKSTDAKTLQVTLESYTRGTSLTKICPTDIVLLMDLSGSMTREINGNEPRIKALKEAAQSFLDALGRQNEGLSPENQSRLSIVRYSDVNLTKEVTTGLTAVSGSGLTELKQHITGLSEEDLGGRTNIQTALDLAGTVLSRYGSPNRDQTVVLFTDGAPAPDQNATEVPMDGFVMSTANEALAASKRLKDKGIRVFGLSIMPGTNSRQNTVPDYGTTYEGKRDYFVADCYGMSYMKTNTSDINGMNLIDRFMFLVTSDNPHAADMDTPNAEKAGDRGKVQAEDGKNYYFSAGNTDALAEAFRSVAGSIVKTESEFGPESEVRDFITSDYRLADADEIRIFTSDYKGNDTWGKPREITGSESINRKAAENSVRVSGFDYKNNYVAESAETEDRKPHGQKLIITFPIRSRRTFGGNAVPTNTAESGIYENDSVNAEAAVLYPVPAADLQINYRVQGGERLVYVPDQAALSEIVPYTEEYKPDGILNRYVNLSYCLLDPNGRRAADMEIKAGENADGCIWNWCDLSDTDGKTSACGTYKVSCTVIPVSGGNYPAASVTDQVKVHVLHPQVVFHDSFQRNGDVVDTPEGNNLQDAAALEEHWDSLSWGCADGISIPSSDETPEIGYKVSIPEGVVTENGKRIIRSEQDIPVVAGVWRISGYVKPVDVTEETEFLHQCGRNESCSYHAVKNEGDPAGARFMIHLSETLPSTGGSGTHGFLAAAVVMASILAVLKAYQSFFSTRSIQA